jgi:lipopolysaccharide transport system ATP-binding protein
MSRPIIEVERLSKLYHLGRIGATTLRDDTRRLWRKLRGAAPETNQSEFWALRDVSFQIQPGEVVGIVGRNGAGKSTLLKILSRITEPTSGRAVMRGRVSSLLEVGSGFNPDLTGRENVFLNGAIMGMKRAEIAARFDEIVAFAEVEQFIDTPVKHYSSGMYVRLAFAVAAHLEPEILIVDEVLAVGDAQFQKKCLGQINRAAANGRTVIFVSHNMIAVQSLCPRALTFDKGRLIADEASAAAATRYFSDLHTNPAKAKWDSPELAPGDDVIRIKQARVESPRGENAEITMQDAFVAHVDFWAQSSRRATHLTFHLLNDEGIVVLTSGFPSRVLVPGMHRATCEFPGSLLNSGGYTLKLLIVENENQVSYTHDAIVSFTVVERGSRDQACLGREPGVVQPPLSWRMGKIDGRD